MKATLACELNPGDMFQINRYSFSPTYVMDRDTKIGVMAHELSSETTITLPHYDIVFKKGGLTMYVLYKSNDDYILTTRENYDAYLRDANKFTVFKRSHGFNTLLDVENFIRLYLKIDPLDIEVIK